MALTLLEAAKIAQNRGETQRAAIIELFARSSDIVAAMPFVDIPGNSLAYKVEAALPGIAFRGVNEAFPESTGVINPRTESLAIAGGDLDVDRYIVQTMGAETRGVQEALKVKALAQAIALKIIKGSSVTDPREFDGLQQRITGTQLISNGTTSGGDPLKLSNIDALIDAVNNPTHLIMNKTLRRRFSVAARTAAVAGDLQFTIDDLGRRVTSYNGLPILVAYEGSGGGSEILNFDEAAASGGSTASSVYCVSFGDNAVTGLQNGVMDVRDLGELPTASVFRTRVEWFVGMAIFNPYAAARLYGVSDAAIVA